jgi:lipopolysaccharide biosynthesis glycosyltransferase
MKKLLTTMSDKNVCEYTKYTLPIFEMWAKKWGADFKVLDDLSYNKLGFAMWNYRSMVFYDWLNDYDQIIYMDSDIIINKSCPDLYNLVPFDVIGMVLEDKGSRRKARLNRIKRIKTKLGMTVDWTEHYFNAGFFIVSNAHKNIFTKINGKLWDGPGYDGLHYMSNIKKHGYKYVDLGYKFNHMSMFSEPWNGLPSRFDSYLIHYAGGGKFPEKGDRDWVELMCDDIKYIYKGKF